MTVAVGKRADLVLLRKNPLEDISHTRTIEGVMIKGRWLSQDDIQSGLEKSLSFNNGLKK